MTGILQDAYQRRIDYLRISVTDRCNLRCTYCMPEDGVQSICHPEILRYEEIEQIVDAAIGLGIRKFRITGGEPLVRKGIVDFIATLSPKKGVEDLSMTTNGTFLTFYAKKLKEAGLDRVNISLDTLKPDRFYGITRTSNLNRVMEGIEAALAENLHPVKINTVLLPENEDEILDFAKLTLDKPLHIRFIEFMPIGAGCKSTGKGLTAMQAMEKLKSMGELFPEKIPAGGGPAKYYRFPGALGTIGFITPMTEHFCHLCNRLRLTAEGKLRACLTLNHEIDLKRILREGANRGELEKAFLQIIHLKPRSHCLGEEFSERSFRGMSEIGG